MLIIFEFPTSSDEWMVPQVVDVLEAHGQKASTFGGVFQHYRPGGFGFRRIVNLLWMLGALPFVLLVRRPDLTVIRSAPPGLHLWGALWLRLLRLRGVCWLMDYHPEIEARALERRAWGRALAALLRGWDRCALNTYEQVIVMDPAMAQAVQANCPGVDTKVFPTWGKNAGDGILKMAFDGPRLAARENGGKSLRLLYGGNLGPAHPVAGLRLLLEALTAESEIQITVVGCSAAGEARFRELQADLPNLEIEIRARMDFHALATLAQSYDFGLLLMSETWAGLLSPSKFAAYLAGGLPLLYLGPEQTNAWRICTEFEAGIAMAAKPADADIVALVQKIKEPETREYCRRQVPAARRHFDSFDAERFAGLLVG